MMACNFCTTRLLMQLALLLCMIGGVATPYSYGQEFDCDISINDRQISGSSVDYTDDLARELESYINESRWTGERPAPQERIRCRMQLILRDVDAMANFDAELIVSMRRPIYNTMQETQAVLLVDPTWRFHYQRGRSLIRDPLQFDELTSVIDFYVYVMLGFDYDSYIELGGSPWFSRARDILELAEPTGSPGWSRNISNPSNRFGLISGLTNLGYEERSEAWYLYHRLGLDQFTTDQEEARAAVMEALELIQENRRQASQDFLFDIFFDTKYVELVSIFRDAPPRERLQAYNLLREVDPGHSSEYERLRN